MKKFAMLVSAVAVLALAASANAAGMYGGIKGGVNIGDVTGDEAPDNTSTRTGIQGGVFLGCPLMDNQFGIRGELLYVQKGVKGDILTEDLDIHPATYKLDYIDIPVLFTANLAAGEKVGFELFAGPSFNFNLSAEADVEGHGTEDLEYIKGFEFGAVIGAGLKYMLSSTSLILDARYSIGASSVSEEILGESPDIKNRGFGIMAGLSFPMGAK